MNFGVKPKGGAAFCHLDERQLSGTVADFVSYLKNSGMLPVTYREIQRTITLRTTLRLLPGILDDCDVENETSDEEWATDNLKGRKPGVRVSSPCLYSNDLT